MRRVPARLAILAFVAACGLPCATASPAETAVIDGKRVVISLEATSDAIHPGQDLRVKLVFRGEGDSDSTATIPAAAFAREQFTIQDPKGRAPGKPLPVSAPAEGLAITGFDTGERILNLSEWYPRLTRRTGVWEVSWSHGSLRAGPLRLVVTKPYDPARDLRAVVETDLGTMTWTLMPAYAPQHVKHFVDLARQGFYDGLTIFKAAPGLYALGGDPNGDGTGGWDKLLPPEISDEIEMGMGLVGSLRLLTSMTNHCVFFILLGPNDYMRGKQTFFARVTDGMEVVARLFRVPSTGDTQDSEAFMLLEPVKIRRITIRK